MKTLMQTYECISECTSVWSYYPKYPVPIKGTWESYKTAYNFIECYFDFAGKSNVFNDPFLKEHKSSIERRAPHIISTYLLGIRLAECFDIDISTRDDHNMDLKYYWFLTCLYHDVGYALEDSFCCSILRNISLNGIPSFIKRHNLDNIDDRVFQTYPREIVDFYFKCRADCQKSKPVIDHGIAGGLLLFDKLLRNYHKAFSERCNRSDTEDDFYIVHSNSRILHFSQQHHNAYAKAADAIIMHNIWKDTLRDYIDRYSSFEELPQMDLSNRITKENELCFILCLADTLEPIKRFCKKNSMSTYIDCKYLNQISLGALNDDRGFQLQMPRSIYDVFEKAITGLSGWINVKVGDPDHRSDSTSIAITI